MPLDPFDARPFKDDLVLGTVAGAEHFLMQEMKRHAESLGSGGGHVRLRYLGAYGSLANSRLYSTCSVELCPLRLESPPELSAIEESVKRSLAGGLMSRLDAPIRFRVSPLRFGRWQIRDFLCERFEWENDPSNWTLNIEAVSGFLVAQFGPLFHSSRFPKLHRIPASTNPVVAAVMIRTLGREWERLLDPLCGTGTLLIEAKALGSVAACYGLDLSMRALDEAKQNLSMTKTEAFLMRADARRIPLADKTVDAIVTNLPFGKRVGSHAANLDLYPRVLHEIARVLVPGGMASLLSEEKRLIRERVGKRIRLRLMDEIPIEMGGLHPSIFRLERL